MRYTVTPILGVRGIPYYVVTDTASGRGIEGYGCATWAKHRADALNRQTRKASADDTLKRRTDAPVVY